MFAGMKTERNHVIFETIMMAIIILLVFLQCRSCVNKSGAELKTEPKITVRTDTIYKTDTLRWTESVQKKNIIPKGIIAPEGKNVVVGVCKDGDGEPVQLLSGAPDLSIAWYSDTTRGADYSIVIDDSIQQSCILSRKVSFNDRRAMLQTVITEKLPAKKEFPLRVFLGLYSYGNKAGQWGVGPSTIVTTRFGLAGMYAYDIHQCQHTVGLYYLLRFKKQK